MIFPPQAETASGILYWIPSVQLRQRSKTSDVIPIEDVIGQASVGLATKVRWHGRIYTAKELLKRIPRNAQREDIFCFDYASREFLEGLRMLCGENINQFALDLEKEVYSDDTTELAVQVEKRVMSGTKVDFTREYYLVPVEARQNVWRGARATLNSGVRGLRSAGGVNPSTPSRTRAQEGNEARDAYDLMDDGL
ncbi:hypothetical protein Aduo_018584 [Ancylostoma duodenale]